MSLRFLVVMAISLAVAACGQADNEADQAALPEISGEAVLAHIEFLADDLLEGRDTGSRGHEIAARYVKAQFKLMGLKPAGDNGTYFQTVPFKSAAPNPDGNSLAIIGAEGEEDLIYGQDFGVRGNFGQESSSVSAEVVFVGFGITAPEFGHDDYAGLDVSGKIVAMLPPFGVPRSLSPDAGAFYNNDKSANAARHGAIGTLFMMTPAMEQAFPFRAVMAFIGAPALKWMDEDGVSHNGNEDIRFSAFLSSAAGEKLLAGSGLTMEDVGNMLAEGGSTSTELAVSVRGSGSASHGFLSSPNVVAVLEGSDSALKDEYIVFTAHLDHIGMNPPSDDGADIINNGALDNASGVALVLEAARAFTRLAEPPRRSIIFAAVTGEEKGLLGASYLANNPLFADGEMVANVDIDMPLILFPAADMTAIGADHSSIGEIAERAAASVHMVISPDPFPEQGFFTRSDHFPFVLKGIPAVLLFGGLNSTDPDVDGAAIWADFMQNHYHKPSDDPSRPISVESAMKFATMGFRIGLEAANDDERPSWNEGDFFGDKFGKSD